MNSRPPKKPKPGTQGQVQMHLNEHSSNINMGLNPYADIIDGNSLSRFHNFMRDESINFRVCDLSRGINPEDGDNGDIGNTINFWQARQALQSSNNKRCQQNNNNTKPFILRQHCNQKQLQNQKQKQLQIEQLNSQFNQLDPSKRKGLKFLSWILNRLLRKRKYESNQIIELCIQYVLPNYNQYSNSGKFKQKGIDQKYHPKKIKHNQSQQQQLTQQEIQYQKQCQNIRRRIYDSINVMSAIGLLTKTNNQIYIRKGEPANPSIYNPNQMGKKQADGNSEINYKKQVKNKLICIKNKRKYLEQLKQNIKIIKEHYQRNQKVNSMRMNPKLGLLSSLNQNNLKSDKQLVSQLNQCKEEHLHTNIKQFLNQPNFKTTNNILIKKENSQNHTSKDFGVKLQEKVSSKISCSLPKKQPGLLMSNDSSVVQNPYNQLQAICFPFVLVGAKQQQIAIFCVGKNRKQVKIKYKDNQLLFMSDFNCLKHLYKNKLGSKEKSIQEGYNQKLQKNKLKYYQDEDYISCFDKQMVDQTQKHIHKQEHELYLSLQRVKQLQQQQSIIELPQKPSSSKITNRITTSNNLNYTNNIGESTQNDSKKQDKFNFNIFGKEHREMALINKYDRVNCKQEKSENVSHFGTNGFGVQNPSSALKSQNKKITNINQRIKSKRKQIGVLQAQDSVKIVDSHEIICKQIKKQEQHQYQLQYSDLQHQEQPLPTIINLDEEQQNLCCD